MHAEYLLSLKIIMDTFINIFSLLGSLGLFLYGMKIMSEGLEKFAGDRLRSILAAMTKNQTAFHPCCHDKE